MGVPLIPHREPGRYSPFIDTVFSDQAGLLSDLADLRMEKYQVLDGVLDLLGPDQLAALRNEILARHGYVFSEAVWRTHFSRKPWYRPDRAFTAVALSDKEKGLIEAIRQREARDSFVLAGGNIFTADLDIDGLEDLVQLERPNWQDDAFTLHVNDQAVDSIGNNLQGYASVVDLDLSDGQKEVLVLSDGPSNDPAFQLFAYDGHGIARGEHLRGGISTVPGDGTFPVVRRAQLLHTWFYTATLRLNGAATLSLVPASEYPTHSHVTALRELPLVAASASGTVTGSILPGELVHLIATDNGRWVKARTDRGVEGWFEVVDFDAVVIQGERVEATEVFEGLSNAD